MTEPYIQLRLSAFELGLLMGMVHKGLAEDLATRKLLTPLWDRMKEKAAVFYEDPPTKESV